MREPERSRLGSPLAVGRLALRNRVFLAPMSGVTDAAFRALAWRYGAGLVFSEMVASEALADGHPEMETKALAADFRPHAVQLAGREPYWMGEAARIAVGKGAELIDINMGCPAKRVTTGQAGSALMREPELAVKLVEAVIAAVEVPVTVKMRLGWDASSLNAPQLAREVEAAGAAMVTVHGRTRCQFYEGSADWEAVAAVRDAIRVPLVVNGDIACEADAREALRASGADAVMVGRGAYGAPWLPGEIAGVGVAPQDILGLAAEHYEAILSLYGTISGIRQARKHLGWYLDRAGASAGCARRRAILTSTDPAAVLAMLEAYVPDAEAKAA